MRRADEVWKVARGTFLRTGLCCRSWRRAGDAGVLETERTAGTSARRNKVGRRVEAIAEEVAGKVSAEERLSLSMMCSCDVLGTIA